MPRPGKLTLGQADLLLHIAVPKKFARPARVNQNTLIALLNAHLVFKEPGTADQYRPTLKGLAWLVENMIPPR